MADICMCNNLDCQKSQTCYRAQATPSEWQSMGTFTLVDGECDFYIEVTKDETIKPERKG